MIGSAFGPGSVLPVMENPRALRIARAGLECWKSGTEDRAGELVSTVLDLVDAGDPVRVLRKREIAGITDSRWTEVIATTCMLAVYAERNKPDPDDAFPFLQVDTFACRCDHGMFFNFAALSTSNIWDVLEPPFDWMCACSVLPMLDEDQQVGPETPGSELLTPQQLSAAFGWRDKTPVSAFHLL